MQNNRKLEKENLMNIHTKVSAQSLHRIQPRTSTFFCAISIALKSTPSWLSGFVGCHNISLMKMIQGPDNRTICWRSISLRPRFGPSIMHNKCQDIGSANKRSVSSTCNAYVVSPNISFMGFCWWVRVSSPLAPYQLARLKSGGEFLNLTVRR